MKTRFSYALLLLLTSTLCTWASTMPVQFAAPPRYLVGATGPYTVLTADFNNDGKADFAVLGSVFGDLAVFLGQGTGGFTPMPTIQVGVGNFPTHMAVGDMNGDGKSDLVVANFGGSTAAVLLGNGDGTFQNPGLFATGASPRWIAVADFNGDGKLDIVSADMGGSISILLGNGDGSVNTARSYPVGFANTLAVGDVNGDGKPDIVSGNDASGDLKILLNTGNGFTTIAASYSGITPEVLELADVDRDGKLDLISGNYYNANVSVLRGNGDGTFQSAVSYTTGIRTQAIVVADLNGDGYPDMVATSTESSLVTPLLGDGKGTFKVGNGYATGVAPMGVAVADFNSDGKLDVVTAENHYNTFSLYFGNGDGSFRGAIAYSIAEGAQDAAVADLNRDGILDMVILQPGNSSALVFLGKGDGSMGLPISIDVGWSPRGVALGDFNKDGIPDLAVAAGDQGLNVLYGIGDGTFGTQNKYDIYGPFSVAAADLNHDGFLDILYSRWNTNDLAVLLGGISGFNGPTTYGAIINPMGLAVGDFNGDGNTDVVSGSASAAQVAVWLGKADATFQAAQTFDSGSAPRSVAVGDINRDGKMDVVTAANDGVWLLPGNGEGTFQNPKRLLSGGYNSVAVSDFNNDGNPDIAATQVTMVSGAAADSVSILFGNGDGTFVGSPVYQVSRFPSVILAADLNSDQSNDLIVVNAVGTGGNATNVTLLLNAAGTNATLHASSSAPVYGDYLQLSAAVQPSIAGFGISGTGDLGTVTFKEGGTTLGSDVVSLSKDAKLTMSTLTAGSHTFAASYSGNDVFNPRTLAPVTIVVQKAASITALAVSSAKVDLGKTATFVATVTGPGAISGTVTFHEGDGTVGCATLDGSGRATFSTTALTAGNHSVTAAYAGDANHNASTSPAATLDVLAASDYSISVSPASASVVAGQRATYTVTLTPVGGFNSAVTFSCSGLPQFTICTFSPQSVTPSGAEATTMMTIATYKNAAIVQAEPPSGSRPIYAMWLAMTCAPGFVLLGNKRTRRWLAPLGLLMVIGLAACGGQGTSNQKLLTTASGTYNVIVSGSAGATIKTTQVTLVVQ